MTCDLDDRDILEDGPAFPLRIQARGVVNPGVYGPIFGVARVVGPLADPTRDPPILRMHDARVEIVVSIEGERRRELVS